MNTSKNRPFQPGFELLVPVDFSDEAAYGFSLAVKIASLNGGHITLFHSTSMLEHLMEKKYDGFSSISNASAPLKAAEISRSLFFNLLDMASTKGTSSSTRSTFAIDMSLSPFIDSFKISFLRPKSSNFGGISNFSRSYPLFWEGAL